jgi:hypothetical protein
MRKAAVQRLALADDAVFVRQRRIAFSDRDNVAADLFVKFYHPGQAADAVAHHHVREQQANGSSPTMSRAHQTAWPRPKRGLLTGKAGGTGSRQHLFQRHQLSGLSARPQGLLEFDLYIEMVFDHGFVSAGDEHEVFDTRCHGLLDNILHDGFVNDGKHLLRHSLGGGQKTCPQSSDGQNRLSDLARHCHVFSPFFMND